MNIINNIFSQFETNIISIIPLTLIGALVSILWVLTNNTSHWASSRQIILNSISNNIFNTFLKNNNKNTNTWHPWIFSIFILCLSYNLFTLLPYTFSQTSHLSITFSLSIPIWLTFQLAGIRHNWKNKLSHLLPQGTPIYLIPFMILIETISLFIQPITLGFRLGANILAGHLLIFLCSCTIWNAINISITNIPIFTLILALFILEIAVACIQAAVFMILSNTYLNENIN